MKIRLAILVVLTAISLVSCSDYEPSPVNSAEIKNEAEIEILNSEVTTDFNSLSYRVTNNGTHTLNCNPEQYTLEFENDKEWCTIPSNRNSISISREENLEPDDSFEYTIDRKNFEFTQNLEAGHYRLLVDFTAVTDEEHPDDGYEFRGVAEFDIMK